MTAPVDMRPLADRKGVDETLDRPDLGGTYRGTVCAEMLDVGQQAELGGAAFRPLRGMGLARDGRGRGQTELDVAPHNRDSQIGKSCCDVGTSDYSGGPGQERGLSAG